MYRKFIKVSLAALAVAATLSFAPAPAAAYDRTQGGVIPGSADDYRFVNGRGYVPNHHRRGRMVNTHQRPMAGQHRGHNRSSRSYREMRMERWSRTTVRGGQGMRERPMRPLVSQVVGTPAVFECDEIRCRSVR